MTETKRWLKVLKAEGKSDVEAEQLADQLVRLGAILVAEEHPSLWGQEWSGFDRLGFAYRYGTPADVRQLLGQAFNVAWFGAYGPGGRKDVLKLLHDPTLERDEASARRLIARIWGH